MYGSASSALQDGASTSKAVPSRAMTPKAEHAKEGPGIPRPRPGAAIVADIGPAASDGRQERQDDEPGGRREAKQCPLELFVPGVVQERNEGHRIEEEEREDQQIRKPEGKRQGQARAAEHPLADRDGERQTADETCDPALRGHGKDLVEGHRCGQKHQHRQQHHGPHVVPDAEETHQQTRRHRQEQRVTGHAGHQCPGLRGLGLAAERDPEPQADQQGTDGVERIVAAHPADQAPRAVRQPRL